MHYSYKMLMLGAILCLFTVAWTASAQTVAPTPDVAARMEQLEAQMTALQSELNRLRQELAMPAATPQTSKAAVSNSSEAKPATEVKATGIDLGTVRATPYGTIFFNAFSDSDATNNSDDLNN